MPPPLDFHNLRVQSRPANPALAVLRSVGLAVVSLVVLTIAAPFRGAESIPIVFLALAIWLAGPGRALLRPLLDRVLTPKRAAVQVWSGALVVRTGTDQKTYAGHEIAEARLWPLARELDLRLTNGKGVQIELPDFEQASALLDAIQVPAQKRVYAARLGPDPAKGVMLWALAGFVSVALTIALLLGGASGLTAMFFLPVIATIVFHTRRAFEELGEVAVSREGITLSGARNQRFLHHGGLRDVRVEPDRLRLFTDDGSEVSTKIEGLDSAAREAIESWLQTGRQKFAGTAAGTDAFSALDRGGRSLAGWREALRTILQQEGQYRRAPISLDDLTQLLANPHTPAERRIAAAFVLSANQTAATEKQIRFAAESSSSQPMRIALRALADERIETAAIEEALAAETGTLAR